MFDLFLCSNFENWIIFKFLKPCFQSYFVAKFCCNKIVWSKLKCWKKINKKMFSKTDNLYYMNYFFSWNVDNENSKIQRKTKDTRSEKLRASGSPIGEETFLKSIHRKTTNNMWSVFVLKNSFYPVIFVYNRLGFFMYVILLIYFFIFFKISS